MRILFFTNEYSHPKLPASGGVGSFLKVMSEGLTKRGHEVHVYGFSKRSIEFTDKSIHFSFFKKYSKQYRFKEFVRSIGSKLSIESADPTFLKQERQFLAKQLKSYCNTHQIDIIESFVFNGFTAYWDNSTPLVLRFHGSRGFWHYYLGAKKDKHKIKMEQQALKATPYLVAVSKFSTEAVKNIYDISIDKIIYNGIDASLFAPDVSIENIEKSIFYFGTLSKAKGVDTLCEVFNEIIEQYPKASLHLIGRGKDYWEDISETILSKKAFDSTNYYGSKQLNDLAELLQKATVCVFPSLNETFGLIVTEAMALEKLVIASDIPSFNEIIIHKHNGFIAKSKKEYVTYISEIFNTPKHYKNIPINARKDILNYFTREKMVENSLNYYQAILHKKI